jgi:hypothetical protein
VNLQAVASIENASARSRKLRMVETRDSRSVSTPHFQGNWPTFAARFPEHLIRAPAHQRHRHLGRGRPPRRPRGCRLVAHAGAHTPLPCCYTCAGALTGRHKPPPAPTAAPAPTRSFQGIATARIVAWLAWAGHVGITGPIGQGGQPRPGAASPFSAPFGRDYLNGLMTWTSSKSSNPGRSSE